MLGDKLNSKILRPQGSDLYLVVSLAEIVIQSALIPVQDDLILTYAYLDKIMALNVQTFRFNK